MIIRSKAPLRISFSGGGTEVSPYKDEYGGVVLSATIDKYAYGSLRARDDRQIAVTSLDYDIVAKYNLDEEMTYDGELDLVKAVIKTKISTKALKKGTMFSFTATRRRDRVWARPRQWSWRLSACSNICSVCR